ncbi:hypothetical protein ACFSC4_04425 [Deinococcus malanensis]|uniref:hypothetical protein n=1 Tax=Deinococcus malanensis TaxID=1706855 RepID=UPI0036344B84
MGIDAPVVGDVVAVVAWRLENGSKPQPGNAQITQVGQRLGHTIQVAAVMPVDVTLGINRVVPRDVLDRSSFVDVLTGFDVVAGISVAETVREDLIKDAAPRPLRRHVPGEILKPAAKAPAAAVQPQRRQVKVVVSEVELPGVAHPVVLERQFGLEPAAFSREFRGSSNLLCGQGLDFSDLHDLERHACDWQGGPDANTYRLSQWCSQLLRVRRGVIVLSFVTCKHHVVPPKSSPGTTHPCQCGRSCRDGKRCL